MKQVLRKPDAIPDWPKLPGLVGMFAGRAVTKEMVPRGVKKFGTWSPHDNKGWEVSHCAPGLYPVGYVSHYTVFYFAKG